MSALVLISVLVGAVALLAVYLGLADYWRDRAEARLGRELEARR